MKQIKSTVRTGVVAMLGNKYWGVLYEDGQCTEIGWTEDIEKAKISDPRYCKKPTDMTWRPRDGRFNSDFDALLNAKLVLIGVTTLYSIDEAAL